ncbi:1085_t:CDS:2, partial [Dentiscutata erythropus]
IPNFRVAHVKLPDDHSPPKEPTKLSKYEAGFQNIQILECQNRVGGRVHTHYFKGDKEQRLYGEHGAMRLPKTEEHQLVFDTIDYLNQRITNNDDKIDLIKFIFADEKKK